MEDSKGFIGLLFLEFNERHEEGSKYITALLDLLDDRGNMTIAENLLRVLHTIKGKPAFMQLMKMA